MVKPYLRPMSIGSMVSEEEFARLEQAAQKASKTLGEWCRDVMLVPATSVGRFCPDHRWPVLIKMTTEALFIKEGEKVRVSTESREFAGWA
jgi:hypothetical protein